MVSVTWKNRCWGLLPISVLSALTISILPVLSFPVLTAPFGNISDALCTPAIQTPSTSTIGPTSFTTMYPLKSVSATSTVLMSLLEQTPPTAPHAASPSAATQAPWFTEEGSPINPAHCHHVSHLPVKPLKQNYQNISSLLRRLCKRLMLSLKTAGPHLHKQPGRLSEMTQHSVYSEKKTLFPLSNSTLHPKSTSLPQTASHKLPSPVSPLPFTSTTSPPPFAKASPVLHPKASTSPPETSASRHPGPLPPPRLQRATGLLFEHQPFIVSWNIPDLVCNRYNVSLDTSPFKGVATPAKVPGQFLSLFYTDRLGLYPHVDLARRKQVNGGIPQRGNLKASIYKARADINYYIPSKTTQGLAVIDWEEWRPLWDRNWGTKRIYQTLSVSHALQTNRSLTLQQATERAKDQFQVAARSLMSGVLALGRAMRPNYLWGFYLFPHCYNYGWEKPDYTGKCSKEVRRQNDELLWLWESSTALYPSVYLQVSLADNPKAALMVRNRVHEALRVSALPRRRGAAPVFVYIRPVFVDWSSRFLSQRDLVGTIGESAAVGASGAVLWGASTDYGGQTSCEALSSYLSSTLNPYITNVTVAAQLCSSFLCRGNGRCVRKDYNSNHYLHLNPENFRILRLQKRYLVLGRPTFKDLKALGRRFTCQCYKGLNCSPRTNRELAKALIFSVKQPNQKTYTLKNAVFGDKQQESITKNDDKKNLKAQVVIV